MERVVSTGTAILAAIVVSSCGGADPLVGSWERTTPTPDESNAGISTVDVTQTFQADGTWGGAITIDYGSLAGTLAGCHEAAYYDGGPWHHDSTRANVVEVSTGTLHVAWSNCPAITMGGDLPSVTYTEAYSIDPGSSMVIGDETYVWMPMH